MRGMFFVLVAATAWGTGGAAAAVLYRDSGLGPLAVSFWRFVIGVSILAAVVALRRRLTPVAAVRRRWGLLVVTGIGMAIYQTAYYAAVAEAGLAIGTVVTLGAGPVLIAFGARLTLGERLGVGGLGAVLLALAGLVLLTGDGGGGGRRPALGIALALLSAVGYAAVTVLTRRVGAAADPYDTALVGFTVGTLCVLPLAVVEGLLPAGTGLAGTLGWLLYLGAVPTALAYALFFAGLARIRATTASVVALIEPVAAALIAVAWLGERLTWPALAGMALLLTAVGALAAAERGRPAVPA